MMKTARTILIGAIGPLGLLLAWFMLARYGRFEDALLPSPGDVAQALGEVARSGMLLESLVVSLTRFAVGYGLAVVFGISLGLILGRAPLAWGMINPVVQLLRPISPIAWFPFVVLFVGIGNAPAMVIIFIAAFFPILLSSVNGASRVDPTVLKVAANFGIRQPALTLRIILPAAFPGIAMGMRIALGSAWVFLVAGEMVGAQSGLGFLIVDARNHLRADLVLAGIVAIGLMGLILDGLIGLVVRRVFAQWGRAPRTGESP